MKDRLIYLPIEPYDCRYSEYLSVPNGVLETCVRDLGVEIVPIRLYNSLHSIQTGQVLDVRSRAAWGFGQTLSLVDYIVNSTSMNPDKDVIYIEDFWHPGFEMIPYAMSLVYGHFPQKWPAIWSFCHAQSVDPNDFTYPMRWWMRGMEQGWAWAHHGICVAAPELKSMLLAGNVGAPHMIHSVGTIWNSAWMKKEYYIRPPWEQVKENVVVYSSRWDTEKQPQFFMQLAEFVLSDRTDVKFYVCTGSEELKSNDPELLKRARELRKKFPDRFVILQGLSKQSYFDVLQKAKVQFNCALQDFVSYTLLEAALCSCAPLYPNYLTFPDALHHKAEHLYTPGDVINAVGKLYQLLDAPKQSSYSWVYEKYDLSVNRMLQAMGFDVPKVPILPVVLERRGK